MKNIITIPAKYFPEKTGGKKSTWKNIFWLYYWLFLSISLNLNITNVNLLLVLVLIFSFNLAGAIYLTVTSSSIKWSKHSRQWDRIIKLNKIYKTINVLMGVYGVVFVGFQFYSFYYYLATSFPNIIRQDYYPLMSINLFMITSAVLILLESVFLKIRNYIVDKHYNFNKKD